MHRAGQKIRAFREGYSPPLSAEEFGARFSPGEAWPSRTVYGWESKGKIARKDAQIQLAILGICDPSDWLEPAAAAPSIPEHAAPSKAVQTVETSPDIYAPPSPVRNPIAGAPYEHNETTLKGPSPMSKEHPFYDFHTHGFVRVATCAPPIRIADPRFNAASILAQSARAAGDHVDILLCPELSLSGYALDDLHLQQTLLDQAEEQLVFIARESAGTAHVLVVGAPLRKDGRLYNCAVAICRGEILGVVPKSYLPNYREYYEKRWFAHGRDCKNQTIRIGQHTVPFGTDLIFRHEKLRNFTFAIEICEDMWSPNPPSTDAALAGAQLILNLSASNITIGKSDERHLLARAQSMRTMSAYAYAASGFGESSSDMAWDGQAMIYELGELLAYSPRFDRKSPLTIADVSCTRIAAERMRTGTFNDAGSGAGHRVHPWRDVGFDHGTGGGDVGLYRSTRRFPFVPNRADWLEEDCYEAFNIQVSALIRRIEATNPKSMVIGVSGGLDSTHALIVAAKACDELGLPRTMIRGYTMPGFATSDHTKSNAWALMKALGITADEIDIKLTARVMLANINHPFADGKEVYDTNFENVQAGLRTDYLFRLAGQTGGWVIGTGDLSELALGWCTYGVGDHMSHYNVNSGVPKTLIQYLIRWVRQTGQFDAETGLVLKSILETEISPELVPPGADGAIQSTEAVIGPYELNDFFLHHIVRYGLGPAHVAFLAWHAWRDVARGEWPADYPEREKHAYDLATICGWLEKFVTRFFGFSQFKRSAVPNGPKVSAAGALSPRGDWRAPSDASADAWLEELRRAVPRD